MEALIVGLTLGLAAGVSPGPLLVLVVTETLRSGSKAGVVTAAAPLVSDAVIVSAVLLVLDQAPDRALPVLGVIGGLYVIWSGVSTWREAAVAVPGEGPAVPLGAAVWRAAVVNFLSPHPWVTWATALGPLVVRTGRDSTAGAVALVVGFYTTLVGAKAVVALLVGRGRGRLSGQGYVGALRAAAVLLVVAGVALILEFAPSLLGG